MPDEGLLKHIDRLELADALQAAPDHGGWRAGLDRDAYLALARAVEPLIAKHLAAARAANTEILRERNTWARQLADMRDERDTAREDAAEHRRRAAGLENRVTALLVELEQTKADLAAWKGAAVWRGAPRPAEEDPHGSR